MTSARRTPERRNTIAPSADEIKRPRSRHRRRRIGFAPEAQFWRHAPSCASYLRRKRRLGKPASLEGRAFDQLGRRDDTEHRDEDLGCDGASHDDRLLFKAAAVVRQCPGSGAKTHAHLGRKASNRAARDIILSTLIDATRQRLSGAISFDGLLPVRLEQE
jgi:hypothetical protein